MNSNRSSPLILKLAVVLVVAGSAVIFGGKYAKRFLAGNEHALTGPGKQTVVPAETPDPFQLSTVSASGTDSVRLLDEDFSNVERMRAIPGGCRDIFESSFVNLSGSEVSKGRVPFADPDNDFEATDAIRGGLPFRRLVLAGLGSKSCFVYYERGGTMYPSSCLAMIDYNQRKAVWIGESHQKARSVEELRFMLSRKQFTATAGPVC